jgi:hypothetical protein
MMNALVGAAVASCVLVGSVEAQAARSSDPFIGVWQVNIERSVYIPGPRPPADLVTLYQFAPLPDGSTRFTLTSMNAQGDLTFQASVFRVDGQRHPVYTVPMLTEFMTSGQETSLMRSYRRIDANTVEFTGYTDGVAGNPVIRQMQPDGNTYIQRPANGQGAVLVLERIR